MLSLVFVGLRMAVRITERQANLIWSEVWLLMGTLCLLGLLVCDTLTYKWNGMSEFHEPSVALSKVCPSCARLELSAIVLPLGNDEADTTLSSVPVADPLRV